MVLQLKRIYIPVTMTTHSSHADSDTSLLSHLLVAAVRKT